MHLLTGKSGFFCILCILMACCLGFICLSATLGPSA